MEKVVAFYIGLLRPLAPIITVAMMVAGLMLAAGISTLFAWHFVRAGDWHTAVFIGVAASYAVYGVVRAARQDSCSLER